MKRPVVLVHGGAGPVPEAGHGERRRGCAAAVEAGWRVLASGGAAVDAVVAAVVVLEDDPWFNAGVGSCLTASGRVEMDASIMDGRTVGAGAAAVLTRVRNPVRLAEAIMREGRHLLMAGAGAEALAAELGLPLAEPASFITARQRALWEFRRGSVPGTVGAVAIDADGHVAAATSTGGRMFKRDGRVGDSAVIGAGTYADDGAGAASATGAGEAIIRYGLAKAAVDLLRGGLDPQWVATHVVNGLDTQFHAEAGIILIDCFGRIGAAYNTPFMIIGRRSADAGPSVAD